MGVNVARDNLVLADGILFDLVHQLTNPHSVPQEEVNLNSALQITQSQSSTHSKAQIHERIWSFCIFNTTDAVLLEETNLKNLRLRKLLDQSAFAYWTMDKYVSFLILLHSSWSFCVLLGSSGSFWVPFLNLHTDKN